MSVGLGTSGAPQGSTGMSLEELDVPVPRAFNYRTTDVIQLIGKVGEPILFAVPEGTPRLPELIDASKPNSDKQIVADKVFFNQCFEVTDQAFMDSRLRREESRDFFYILCVLSQYMELAWAEEEAKWVYEQDLLEEIAEANEKPLGPSVFVFEPPEFRVGTPKTDFGNRPG